MIARLGKPALLTDQEIRHCCPIRKTGIVNRSGNPALLTNQENLHYCPIRKNKILRAV